MVGRYTPAAFVHCFVVMLFLSTAVSTTRGQNQVTLAPSKDNTLYESATGALSNGAGSSFFAGRTNQLSGSIRRGLVAFDVAGGVPAGATITNVTLTLTMTQTSFGTGTEPVSLHRALTNWGEGTSVALGNEGQGAPATAGDATWIHCFFNTTFWSTPGGDFVAAPSATQSVADSDSYTWGSTSQMVSDVQGWLNTPGNNFGWLLRGNEDSSQTAKRFASRQNLDPAIRPRLTITFLPPVSVRTDDPLAREFSLHQNYPNPFNPSTNVEFSVMNAEFVTLKVYNLLGQEVATLVNEVRAPGEYTVRWDARGLTSGVYLYRLTAGSFVQTRKLTLMR